MKTPLILVILGFYSVTLSGCLSSEVSTPPASLTNLSLTSYTENEVIQTWEIGSLIRIHSDVVLEEVFFHDVDTMTLDAAHLQIFLESKQWYGQGVHLQIINSSNISVESDYFTYDDTTKLATFSDRVLLIDETMHIEATSLEYNSLSNTMLLTDSGGIAS
ncbi:OstA-like protein [Entomospira nematocerorum]|uniref:Organic solvent tolerance-like N-terminal domain-containing protein n=1 Tax=Entomospira nematocerorum TaxID=2719987 RepID=A0A968KYD3_9SPIO|nr:OstA-like protein [Entomospira nematocera]NIZ47462.1 hypothetical protein [Entomospira nematocera]WDI33998.1 OstA-like protein [Entomospira nematocera]